MRYYRCRRGRRMGPKAGKQNYNQGRGRPLKEIIVEDFPKISRFSPEPKLSEKEIHLTIAEYEAMRLVDREGLNQDEAGEFMNVSRGTIWRLLDSGREKISTAIVEGRVLIIENQSFCEDEK